MYNLETVESLHSYAGRLQRDALLTRPMAEARRPHVRSLLRKVRRTG